jgi:hypothetical protein
MGKMMTLSKHVPLHTVFKNRLEPGIPKHTSDFCQYKAVGTPVHDKSEARYPLYGKE